MPKNDGKALGKVRLTLQEKPRKGTAYGYAVRSRVILLSERGMHSNELSEMTGIDASVIRRWLRRYRTYGRVSLQPFWRPDRPKDTRRVVHAGKDQVFQNACDAYATSREPVASITRRFGLDYHSFKYHVERYHPELVEVRSRLKDSVDKEL